MKDQKRRILQEFIKLFADEKVVDVGSSEKKKQHASSGKSSNSDGRIYLDDKIDNNYYDGYRGVFSNILSYLDEFDLALSIQPTCKLFQNFSRNDDLWENLMKFYYNEDYMADFISIGSWEEFKKKYESLSNFKEKFVASLREYHSIHYKNYGRYAVKDPSPVERKCKKFKNCGVCSDGIDDDEPYIVTRSGYFSSKAIHIGCVDKESFREAYPHVLRFLKESSPYKQIFIDSIYRTRIFDNITKTEEEMEDEEEVPEFSCDICEEPIHRIRYNCLDCNEYDLCGYCCEKIIMKQKGSTLKMCQSADHPHDHTFQSIGEEEFGTYSCNKCMEKIRGFRYHKLHENDYDLCTLCFYASNEKDSYERIDLLGESPVEALYTTFCEKLLLKELKTVIESVPLTLSGNMSKKQLSSNLLDNLETMKENNTRPSICSLVSSAERFCCKDQDGTVLPNSAPNGMVFSVELADEAVKPPKKKTKLN